jgi:RimJ/RimL family protein N-acetyltransferase
MESSAAALILTASMAKRSRIPIAKTLPPLPPTWLVGKLVRLRAIEPSDVRMLQRWINASPAREWILPRFPLSEAAERDWAAHASVDGSRRVFIIQTLDGHDIGTVGLFVERARATLGIAIHDDRYWSNGYGTDAVRVLVNGAFAVLPLVRIDLLVYTDNERAIRCYKKAGFTAEGVLRSYEWGHGRYRDILMMSVLHDEWPARSHPRTAGRRGSASARRHR